MRAKEVGIASASLLQQVQSKRRPIIFSSSLNTIIFVKESLITIEVILRLVNLNWDWVHLCKPDYYVYCSPWSHQMLKMVTFVQISTTILPQKRKKIQPQHSLRSAQTCVSSFNHKIALTRYSCSIPKNRLRNFLNDVLFW